MLQPMFCIDINTHKKLKQDKKLCENLFKKLFFQNVLVFVDLFCGYHYIHYDVMCVQYVTQ